MRTEISYTFDIDSALDQVELHSIIRGAAQYILDEIMDHSEFKDNPRLTVTESENGSIVWQADYIGSN